jgi:DNA-binding NarL/FixJ family response regulator
VRVVLADDSVLLRAGVAELLRLEGFEVVGEAGNADELLALVRSERPDVAVVDVRMPPTHTVEGLEAARQLRREHGSAVGVLVLSQHLEARHAVELLAESSAGIGYLLKDRVLGPQDLAEAVRRVGSGGSAIDPDVVTFLMRRRHGDHGLESLTEREREVLALVAEGHSNRSVAAQLFISEKTVEGAITRIFDKLDLAGGPDAHRRVQAVLAWLRPSG